MVLFSCLNCFASDWPQWRGLQRDGITVEHSGWPDGWPGKRLWGFNAGFGCTSPVIAGDNVYVMGWKGKSRGNPVGKDTLYCLDLKTGKVKWKQSYTSRYQSRIRTGDTGSYGGPSSTPVFDVETGFLYTLSIDGDFCCWDTTKNGKLLWKKNFYDTYNVQQRPDCGKGVRDYGYTSSPLIDGGLVIVETGDSKGTVMAFDKTTGKLQWQSGIKGPAGHSSGPVPMTVDGMNCIATLTLTKLAVMRTDSGFEGVTIAKFPWKTDYGCNIATPAVFDNKVLISSSYNNHRSCLLDISQNGAKQIWKSKYHSKVSSPVIYKNCIYMINGPLYCLDLGTGKLKWKGGNFGNGSLLVCSKDDKIIAFGNGKIVLIDAEPADNKYHELSRIDNVVSATCYPHIALSDGIICCKDRAGNIVCFSVSGSGEQ